MTKKYKYLLLTLALATVFGSCTKETPQEYNDIPRVYFWNYAYRLNADTLTQRDSLSLSFIDQPLDTRRCTVDVVVQTMGPIVNYDRKFAVRQSNAGESLAAVPNTHYVPLSDVENLLYVPAGSDKGIIPVIALNDESLSRNEYRLGLELLSNDNFELGITAHRTFLVKLSNILVKPALWGPQENGTYVSNQWGYYFGDWSQTKMRFLISSVTGDIEWEEGFSTVTVSYYQQKARDELKAYNDAHPNDPLRDENNELVTF